MQKHTMGIKDLRDIPKPQVSPDRTETGLGSGNIFKNILGSGWVEAKDNGAFRGRDAKHLVLHDSNGDCLKFIIVRVRVKIEGKFQYNL